MPFVDLTQIKARFLASKYVARARGVYIHWPELPASMISAVRFILHKPIRPTVLLVEPNTYHGETLPSYLHYLAQLGYDSVLICRRVHLSENCFCRVIATERVKAFAVDPIVMRWLLGLSFLKRYHWLFLTSRQVADPHYRMWGRYLGSLKKAPLTRYGSVCVEHSLSFAESIASLRRDRTLVLCNSSSHPYAIPDISAHHFGSVRNPDFGRSKPKFVFVGRSSVYRASLTRLIEISTSLREVGYSFEIGLVGPSAVDFPNHTIPEGVRLYGRLRFPELYDLVESSDFIIPLLDADDPSHADYLGRLVSGSRQLILGFNKVPIIEEIFARHYKLPEDGAVVYASGCLRSGLVAAITMSEQDYEKRRIRIVETASFASQRSLENLRNLLEVSVDAVQIASAKSVRAGTQ